LRKIHRFSGGRIWNKGCHSIMEEDVRVLIGGFFLTAPISQKDAGQKKEEVGSIGEADKIEEKISVFSKAVSRKNGF
jgi:hypothetical protein